MPHVSAVELAYYAELERAVGGLTYLLENCRHTGWCNHRYALRIVVREIQAAIEARQRAAGAPIALLPGYTTLRPDAQGED